LKKSSGKSKAAEEALKISEQEEEMTEEEEWLLRAKKGEKEESYQKYKL
jgi:hypothetical protein